MQHRHKHQHQHQQLAESLAKELVRMLQQRQSPSTASQLHSQASVAADADTAPRVTPTPASVDTCLFLVYWHALDWFDLLGNRTRLSQRPQQQQLQQLQDGAGAGHPDVRLLFCRSLLRQLVGWFVHPDNKFIRLKMIMMIHTCKS